MYQPLADLLRPTNLDEVFGQEHILGEGAILRRLILLRAAVLPDTTPAEAPGEAPLAE
jgi:replication-associated recombination protein RarA